MGLTVEQGLSQLSQGQLDLESKERSNLFPWRGQFSPGLVEILLKTYGSEEQTVLDPFAGVGTTLFEAAKLGMRGRGTELNPSAFLMAQSVEWIRYENRDREMLIVEARSLLEKLLSANVHQDPFRSHPGNVNAVSIAKAIREKTLSNEITHILANTLIRGLANGNNFIGAFRHHVAILMSLPHLPKSQQVYQADARRTPLAPQSVDLILTSPPYINVFNYHENNRKAMELIGWDILSVAKAEVGSNRKNRGNRFLTVIQYCLDMKDALNEMRRVLKPDGKIIIVIGRESSVRGIPFENGKLINSLAPLAGFRSGMRQSRRFTNRFGQSIFEDILHLSRTEPKDKDAREVALDMLEAKRKRAMAEDVRGDLEDAIRTANVVSPSPIYAIC